jgi:probable F420-dependent oxidoreductase
MKFGVSLIMRGTGASPEAFFALASHAEALGYDSLWCSDHIFFPKIKLKYPNTPHGGIPPEWHDGYWHCFTVMNQVLARTKRVTVGASVLILPMHHPIEVAKEIATLDQFSNGRVIFGVGVGWLKEEFDALSWPFEERGARTDEGLEICRKLWTEARATHTGRFYQFEEANCTPKPAQKPHPPIWVGGHSKSALKRVAKYGDVWHPFKATPAMLKETMPDLRRVVEEHGRKPESIGVAPKVMVGFQDTPPQAGQDLTEGRPQDILDAVRRYQDAGTTHLVMDFKPQTLDTGRAMLDRFASEVRSKV